MENLQSSVNKNNGTISLAAVYSGYLFSACFLPSLLIKYLGEKWTLVLGSFWYSIYMAALFYPELYLLIPTGIVLGLSAGCLWSAKGIYITKAGRKYSQIIGETSNAVITRFFTIFYMFYQSTQVIGNLLSSLVLSSGDEIHFNRSSESLSLCGTKFCIEEANPEKECYSTVDGTDCSTNENSSTTQFYILSGVYVAGSIVASLIFIILLDPVKRFEETEDQEPSTEKTSCQLIMATFTHLKHPYQLLMVPLSIWSGIERAFLGADFTAAYVTCGLGVNMVGYVMICYGTLCVLSSMSASFAVKVLGRPAVLTLAFLINISCIVTLNFWTPNLDQIVIFFVISGLWGVADALWITQINSLYGILFPGNSEAAFSNCRLWEATGFTIAFGCSSVLCMNQKIIVSTVFLVLGVLGYYILELLEMKKEDRF